MHFVHTVTDRSHIWFGRHHFAEMELLMAIRSLSITYCDSGTVTHRPRRGLLQWIFYLNRDCKFPGMFSFFPYGQREFNSTYSFLERQLSPLSLQPSAEIRNRNLIEALWCIFVHDLLEFRFLICMCINY